MDLAAHYTVSVLGRGASSSPVTYRGGAMTEKCPVLWSTEG